MMLSRRVYVASSWRNAQQPAIVASLRSSGHEVYDFRNPLSGFAWRDCEAERADDEPGAGATTISSYLDAIATDVARKGFACDKDALDWADTCVLVMPCGRSAHLEAGYAAGQGKDVFVLLSDEGFEPELMYLLCTGMFTSIYEIIAAMSRREPYNVARFHSLKGGHWGRSAGHALRILREVVELCVASGASQYDVCRHAIAELEKARERKEFFEPDGPLIGHRLNGVIEEWADVALLLEVFRFYVGIDAHAAMRAKLDVCWDREWQADEDGVLNRPRR